MGSGAVIYIPSFIKIGSGVQKLIEGDTQTATQSHKPTPFFQIKQSRLKIFKQLLQHKPEGLQDQEGSYKD
jgi:hypothetical protein